MNPGARQVLQMPLGKGGPQTCVCVCVCSAASWGWISQSFHPSDLGRISVQPLALSLGGGWQGWVSVQ